LQAYLRGVHLLTLNKDEATQLLLSNAEYAGRPNDWFDDAGRLAEALALSGINMVAVTDGADGAYLYASGHLYFRPAARLGEAADTTGVGDAFGATLACGFLLYPKDPARALSMAMLNSASVVSKPGAQNGQLSKSKLMSKLKDYEKSL
jgi:sugar/nucleoside kinase (ribokinase family)